MHFNLFLRILAYESEEKNNNIYEIFINISENSANKQKCAKIFVFIIEKKFHFNFLSLL